MVFPNNVGDPYCGKIDLRRTSIRCHRLVFVETGIRFDHEDNELKTSKTPPWKISVWRKQILIEAFEVPAQKLGSHEVQRFLHALVVRLRTETLQDMVPYYVNNRKGQPCKKLFDYAGGYENQELTEFGFWCGSFECYARATQTMNKEWGDVVRKLREQNRPAFNSG